MLEWFTTIPGILIICGVILLVIAVVLFVVGSKKDKKAVVDTVAEMASNVANNEEVTPIAPVNAIDSMNVEVTNNDVNVPEVETTPEPIVISEPEVSMPEVSEVSVEEPITDYETSIEIEPVINIPNMEVTEANNEVAAEVTPVETSIYGGETPVVDFAPVEEKPVSIYGGNDPLEATQSIPKMEENHVPYGGEYPEVKIVEPVVEQPVYTPVEDTVSAMPEVTPVVEPTVPEVSIPDVNPEVEVNEPVVSEVVVENNDNATSTVEEL